jgi:hypothetical protein
MHSSFLKQVAYNQRVFKAEEATAAINTEVADFLLGHSTDPAEPVIICVSADEQRKRYEQAVAGQLWMQGDRKMSAANVPLPGMANDSSAALLTAVVEAVEWKHAMLAFSQGLSRLSCDLWAPQPTAEAPEKLAKIANDAAISRLRPIADGPNQWIMHRSSAHTVGPGSLSSSIVGTESGPTTGLTDTCVAQGNPS